MAGRIEIKFLKDTTLSLYRDREGDDPIGDITINQDQTVRDGAYSMPKLSEDILQDIGFNLGGGWRCSGQVMDGYVSIMQLEV